MNKKIYAILLLATLFSSYGCGGGNNDNPNNGDPSVEVKLSRTSMDCNQNCIASIDLETSNGFGTNVTVTIIQRGFGNYIYNPGPQYYATGETPFITIICNQIFTAPGVYDIEATFSENGITYDDEATLSITGSGGVTPLTASCEFDYMNAASYTDYSDDMLESAKETFKVDNFKVTISSTSFATTSSIVDFTWDQRVFPSFGTWFVSPNGLQPFIDNNRIQSNPPKYYIVTARQYTAIDNNGNEDIETDGLSGNINASGGRNYSMLFMKNIDIKLPRDPNVRAYSYRNLVINHELLHQLGGIGVSGHDNHTQGEKFYSCALNWASTVQIHASSYLYNLTSIWPVCDNHVTECRYGLENLDLPNYFYFGREKIKSASYNANNNDILEISLQKSSYKIFEPIEILVKYINTGNEKDSIYDIFRDELDNLKFYIQDDKGRIYNTKYAIYPFQGILRKPRYIVDPGDTVVAVMNFDFYGNITDNIDSMYFGNNGYFPIGRYSGYAYVEEDYNRIFNPLLKSNNINFEITPLSNQDKEVLNLIKGNNINYLLSTDNYFVEYIFREKVRQTLVKFLNKEIKVNELLELYLDFIAKYPDSYYSLYYIQQYILEKANATSDINTIVNDLLNAYPNTIVSRFLSNKTMKEKIISNYEQRNKK